MRLTDQTRQVNTPRVRRAFVDLGTVLLSAVLIRKYTYFPIRHVQRGATWGAATYMCGGKAWGPLLTKCYHDEDWSSVNLDEFLACDHNMAANRQTRMLADLGGFI